MSEKPAASGGETQVLVPVAVAEFFVQCVATGTTDVFVDLREWGLTGPVLALMFHDARLAFAALTATMRAGDGSFVRPVPREVAEMFEAARVALSDDLDAKLRATAKHALGSGTPADEATAQALHRAVMHILVGFMGLGLTAADIGATARALGIAPAPSAAPAAAAAPAPAPARVPSVRAKGATGRAANVWAKGYAKRRARGSVPAAAPAPAPALAPAPGPVTKGLVDTGQDGAFGRERVWSSPVTPGAAPVGSAGADGGADGGAGGCHMEAGEGSGCASAAVEPPRAAAVPSDVKTFAEEFVRAAHQNTLQRQWSEKPLRAGVLDMRPQHARALYFCATRTGGSAGRSYWERVFACDLIDARTVLGVLRAFDGHGVPIFGPLEQDVSITELAEQRARREPTFALVVSWLRAAKSSPEAAGSRQAGAGNIAFPLATARTVAEPDAEAQARHAAGPEGACLVCGRTPGELQALGRTQTLGPSSDTGGAGSGVLSRCGRCGHACYCSAVCQRWHWRRGHREDCSGS
jgi:hypothetical protein